VVRHQLLQWLAESATHEALQQMSRGDLRGDFAAGIGSQILGQWKWLKLRLAVVVFLNICNRVCIEWVLHKMEVDVIC